MSIFIDYIFTNRPLVYIIVIIIHVLLAFLLERIMYGHQKPKQTQNEFITSTTSNVSPSPKMTVQALELIKSQRSKENRKKKHVYNDFKGCISTQELQSQNNALTVHNSQCESIAPRALKISNGYGTAGSLPHSLQLGSKNISLIEFGKLDLLKGYRELKQTTEGNIDQYKLKPEITTLAQIISHDKPTSQLYSIYSSHVSTIGHSTITMALNISNKAKYGIHNSKLTVATPVITNKMQISNHCISTQPTAILNDAHPSICSLSNLIIARAINYTTAASQHKVKIVNHSQKNTIYATKDTTFHRCFYNQYHSHNISIFLTDSSKPSRSIVQLSNTSLAIINILSTGSIKSAIESKKYAKVCISPSSNNMYIPQSSLRLATMNNYARGTVLKNCQFSYSASQASSLNVLNNKHPFSITPEKEIHITMQHTASVIPIRTIEISPMLNILCTQRTPCFCIGFNPVCKGIHIGAEVCNNTIIKNATSFTNMITNSKDSYQYASYNIANIEIQDVINTLRTTKSITTYDYALILEDGELSINNEVILITSRKLQKSANNIATINYLAAKCQQHNTHQSCILTSNIVKSRTMENTPFTSNQRIVKSHYMHIVRQHHNSMQYHEITCSQSEQAKINIAQTINIHSQKEQPPANNGLIGYKNQIDACTSEVNAILDKVKESSSITLTQWDKLLSLLGKLSIYYQAIAEYINILTKQTPDQVEYFEKEKKSILTQVAQKVSQLTSTMDSILMTNNAKDKHMDFIKLKYDATLFQINMENENTQQLKQSQEKAYEQAIENSKLVSATNSSKLRLYSSCSNLHCFSKEKQYKLLREAYDSACTILKNTKEIDMWSESKIELDKIKDNIENNYSDLLSKDSPLPDLDKIKTSILFNLSNIAIQEGEQSKRNASLTNMLMSLPDVSSTNKNERLLSPHFASSDKKENRESLASCTSHPNEDSVIHDSEMCEIDITDSIGINLDLAKCTCCLWKSSDVQAVINENGDSDLSFALEVKKDKVSITTCQAKKAEDACILTYQQVMKLIGKKMSDTNLELLQREIKCTLKGNVYATSISQSDKFTIDLSFLLGTILAEVCRLACEALGKEQEECGCVIAVPHDKLEQFKSIIIDAMTHTRVKLHAVISDSIAIIKFIMYKSPAYINNSHIMILKLTNEGLDMSLNFANSDINCVKRKINNNITVPRLISNLHKYIINCFKKKATNMDNLTKEENNAIMSCAIEVLAEIETDSKAYTQCNLRSHTIIIDIKGKTFDTINSDISRDTIMDIQDILASTHKKSALVDEIAIIGPKLFSLSIQSYLKKIFTDKEPFHISSDLSPVAYGAAAQSNGILEQQKVKNTIRKSTTKIQSLCKSTNKMSLDIRPETDRKQSFESRCLSRNCDVIDKNIQQEFIINCEAAEHSDDEEKQLRRSFNPSRTGKYYKELKSYVHD